MALDTIKRRSFESPIRQEVHDRACEAVERDSERFLADYKLLPETNEGRYICTDTFKELFPAYAASKAGRNVFNAPVHNAAAVLAAEQYRRMLNLSDNRHNVLLVTGIPGAGKTYAFSMRDLANYRLVYEGQLSDLAETDKKIRQALEAGLWPTILVVDSEPERALRNTLARFEDEGRGAGIKIMAKIQAGLPATLLTIAESYPGLVNIETVHMRQNNEPLEISADIFQYINRGNSDEIEHKLNTELAVIRQERPLSDAAIRQSRSQTPNARSIRDAGRHVRAFEPYARGFGISTDSQRQEQSRQATWPGLTQSADALIQHNAQDRTAGTVNGQPVGLASDYLGVMSMLIANKIAQADSVFEDLQNGIQNINNNLSDLDTREPDSNASTQVREVWELQRDKIKQRMETLENRVEIVRQIAGDGTNELDIRKAKVWALANEKVAYLYPDLANAADTVAKEQQEHYRQIIANTAIIQAQSQQQEPSQKHTQGRGMRLSLDQPS